jgi:hypothetical protein
MIIQFIQFPTIVESPSPTHNRPVRPVRHLFSLRYSNGFQRCELQLTRAPHTYTIPSCLQLNFVNPVTSAAINPRQFTSSSNGGHLTSVASGLGLQALNTVLDSRSRGSVHRAQ